MMMRDGDSPKLLSHTRHADRALYCVNDISDCGPKSIDTLGAFQQRRDHLIHPVDCRTDFPVEVIPFDLA
jgi:hypothetical protein